MPAVPHPAPVEAQVPPHPRRRPGAPAARLRGRPTAALHRHWPLVVATVGVLLVAYAGWARGGDAISWPFTVVGVVAYVAFLLIARAQTTPAVSSSAPVRAPGATRRSS